MCLSVFQFLCATCSNVKVLLAFVIAHTVGSIIRWPLVLLALAVLTPVSSSKPTAANILQTVQNVYQTYSANIFSLLLYFALFSGQFGTFHNLLCNVTNITVSCVHLLDGYFILYCSVCNTMLQYYMANRRAFLCIQLVIS